MKRLTYVSLQKNVLSNNLGGKSHVFGVIEGLKDRFDVTLVAAGRVSSDELVARANILPGFAYYFRVFWLLILDRNTDVFLFRKTLVGMYFVFFAIVLKRAAGSKQSFYMEFNGISGDFSIGSRVLKRFLLFLNALPVVAFNGVYCVNGLIADRLSTSCLVDKRKVIVCLNGGGRFLMSAPPMPEDSLDIVYFGAERPFYHVQALVSAVTKMNSAAGNGKKLIKLHLIGPGMSHHASENVLCYGSVSLSEFRDIRCSFTGKAWGVIPLEKLEYGCEIEPIKTFDYLRCSLPILHSTNCLSGFDVDGNFTIPYDSEREELILKLDVLLKMSTYEYLLMAGKIESAYSEYTWKGRLRELAERMDA